MSGLDRLSSLPEVTHVAINGRGALEPGCLVADGRWAVELVPLACTSPRTTCRVNLRREYITKVSVYGDMEKIKG